MHVRIPENLAKPLAELARQNKRSAAGENGVAIEAYLAEHRAKMKAGAKIPKGNAK